MKKALLSLILCAGVLGAAMAQGDGITTKRDKGKGYNILPEAGDWGIGFDANPFLKPVLNIFNNTGSNAPFTADFIDKNAMKIAFYMAVDDETYYRAGLRIGFLSHSDKIPAGVDKFNTLSQTAFTIGLTGGIEKIKSLRHRLIGYYGGQVNIDLLPATEEITIGADKFQTRGSVTFTDVNTSTNSYKHTGGSKFTFGVGAFVGVRYFVAPKISLGAEYGWGLYVQSIGKRTVTQNGNSASGKSSFEFNLDTSATSQLVLAFWF